jgi:nucleoside-diphosphate-sugar epimerase
VLNLSLGFQFKLVVDMARGYSKILVSGGAGFIGSHIVDRLISEDIEVTVIDNLHTGYLRNIKHNRRRKDLHFVRGDVRDFNLVRSAVKDVDAVFHEAAFVDVAQSIENPVLTNEVNVNGTLNILKASLDLGVKRFILASSAAVYGSTLRPRKREDDPLNPTSPYGVSKLTAENYARLFDHLYGMETVSLRYFNVYGPRQSFNIRSAYGGVIALCVNRLVRNIPPTIYGDGEQTRDFVYVQDVVEANMLALNTNNAVGETFNIGSGTSTSINQIAELLKGVTNKENLHNMYSDPRPGDIRHGYADISKARKRLGYNPKFSIKEGLTELLNWYAKNGHLNIRKLRA